MVQAASEDYWCDVCGEWSEPLPGYPHRCKQNRKENARRKPPDVKKQNEQHNDNPNRRTDG